VSSGEKYAAAAYAVVLLTVLVWIAIMAAKFARLEREKADLQELLRQKTPKTPSDDG
jgi:type II secretory pathway component PulM